MNFENNIKKYIDAVNKKLECYLSPKYPEDIYKAMGYSVFAGGKRVRPVLMLAACEAFGGNIEDVLPYACGLEMIHTYSLIHDDLPAMDNDDYRRGKLTCHKAFNEGLAILAGDGLLTYAFDVMLSDALEKRDFKYVYATKTIAKLSGMNGMLVGQVVDVESEGKKIDLIKQQNTASFEMDTKHQLVEADVACSYSYLYQSIMGKGKISLVDDPEEKINGLECVMLHYSNNNTWKFNEEVLKRVAVIKIEVTEWSCKEH